MPVVANSKTPVISNFSKLTIPCCQECNSSKANKPWREFAKKIEMKGEKLENLEYLQTQAMNLLKKKLEITLLGQS
jgi:hypothetical protein